MTGDKVWLREVGLRDGLQGISDFLPTATKTFWCDEAAHAGIPALEVTSLVPPRLLPQFADAEAVIAHALTLPGVATSALVPNLRGAERGLALGVPQLNYVLSVSDAHNLSNVRRSTLESIKDFRRIVELRDAGAHRVRISAALATAFGCSISGAVDEHRTLAVAEAMLEAGADEIMFADTVGYADPAQVARLFRAILRDAGGVPVAAHFHNTRGLGLANVLAALDAGVRRFDASLGGLGGCPFAPGATGNIATEDCAYMLNQMGFDTGVDVEALLRLRVVLAGELPGGNFQGELARSGIAKNYCGVRVADLPQGGNAAARRAPG